MSNLRYDDIYFNDVDLWLHFATTFEVFRLNFVFVSQHNYEYKHLSIDPFGCVNWSNVVSLLIGYVELTDGAWKMSYMVALTWSVWN